MIEQWKDVPNWNGRYQVSNYGRLLNTQSSKIIVGSKDQQGYLHVSLCGEGRREDWLLHRLIASVWFRPLCENENVHHKNEFICCNCINNLQIKNEGEHISSHKIGKQFSLQHRMNISKSKRGKHSAKKK